MEPRKNPEYLKFVAGAVREFRDAFVLFLELHVTNDGPQALARGTAPAVFPREDADPAQIARLAAKVSRAAGRAADAAGLTGITMLVQGVGQVDPIAAWQTITMPKPVVEAAEILGVCEQALGRLEGLIMKAQAEAPPRVGAAAMHPIVWGASSRLLQNGMYRHAVTSAAEAVVQMVKSRTRRYDLPSDKSLWEQVFNNAAPEPGKPRLRWPGDPTDRTVKSMNDGLKFFSVGVQMTIRNTAAHSTGEIEEQEALERLSTLSLLARWVDACELVPALTVDAEGEIWPASDLSGVDSRGQFA